MTSLIYETSAATCARLLNNLLAILDKAEAHAAEKKIDMAVLMQSRLYPDMFPLSAQIGIAAAFSKNLVCRLAAVEPPDYPNAQLDLESARALIKRTLDVIANIDPKSFEGAEARPVTFNAAPNTPKTMSGADYLNKFALPNIIFHAATAYDILRHNGVPLGKRDFIGSLD